MRKWATLLFLAAFSCPAMASKSLPVEDVEQLLAKLQGKSDGRVAQELAEVELTERVSLIRLAKWEKNFDGSKSREELMRLADRAAFLKVPAEDEIRDPAPDPETQARMFDLAVEYVKATIGRLPNFLAKRETTHFEDMPWAEPETTNAQGLPGHSTRPFGLSLGRPEGKPLHVTGRYNAVVTFRDGAEVRDTPAKDAKAEASPTGLTTYGEFGPMLGAVLEDAGRGQVSWSHWEQGENEPVAVFHYSVPEDHSNWMVGIPNGTKAEMVYPAYHGEIAIEPATGSVLRLSAVAEMAPPHQMIEDAILVEYAPVEIGDRTYICPVHGVAYSKVPVESGGQAAPNSAVMVQTQLNDVRFTQYHLFTSEAHILADGKAESDGKPPATGAPAAPPGSAPQAPGPDSASPGGAPTPEQHP